MIAHGLRKDWHVAEEDRPGARSLSAELDVPHLVAHLLMRRGAASAEGGRRFLSPDRACIVPPAELPDMDAAVDRIRAARNQGERVLVFGDYDVDGMAGTALLVQSLRAFGVIDLHYEIPCRLNDGYGLSPRHVEEAARNGVGLIVTVDNGIAAREAADTARARGIDLVVTDHHLPEGNLPHACALVNPRLLEPGHPASEAAGALVAAKLAWALTGEEEHLDLAALGTVADVVPLHGENRAVAALGLERIARRPRPGLLALCRAAGLRPENITAENIAFQLGPRLNAAARMGHADVSLELLLCEDPYEGDRIARRLEGHNAARKECERAIYDQAVEEVNRTGGAARRTIVLARPGWHPGVVGVVAAKLQEAFHRPVALLAVGEDGEARGSVRGTDAFHVMDALVPCQDLLLRFGGHAGAGGLTLNMRDFEAFVEAFERAAESQETGEPARPRLDVDALVSLGQIDPRLVRSLDALQPFGQANPAPAFCTFGVDVPPESIRVFKDAHVAFRACQGSASHKAIAFNMVDWCDPAHLREAAARGPLALAYSPRLDTWKGRVGVQLFLDDISFD